MREKFFGFGIVENIIFGFFGWGRCLSCFGVSLMNFIVGGNLVFLENRDSFGKLIFKIVWIIIEVKSVIYIGWWRVFIKEDFLIDLFRFREDKLDILENFYGKGMIFL